jgi:phosphohistidine phosphatase
MELVLLRHADAGDQDPARYPDDGLRPLTDKGRRTQHAVARALQRMGVGFDRLLTSPLVRARETAAITCEVVGCKGTIEVLSALGDDYSAGALLRALGACRPDSRVGCVGHEPHLSRFAAACLDPNLAASPVGGASRASPGHGASQASSVYGASLVIELPKSGIIALAFEGSPALGAARLRYVLRPEHLLALLD